MARRSAPKDIPRQFFPPVDAAAGEYVGRITGQVIAHPKGKRGRPPEYINADARKLSARLEEVERLILTLARDPGFTPLAHRTLAAQLFGLKNMLDVNNRDPLFLAWRKWDRAQRTKNPTTTHGLLITAPDGRQLTLCGARPSGALVDGVWVPDEPITRYPRNVECKRCRAVIVDEMPGAVLG